MFNHQQGQGLCQGTLLCFIQEITFWPVSACLMRKNVWSIPNFNPKPVDGEDESTLRKHEKLLQVYLLYECLQYAVINMFNSVTSFSCNSYTATLKSVCVLASTTASNLQHILFVYCSRLLTRA